MSLAPLLNALGEEHGVRGLQLTDSSKAPLVSWGHAPSAEKNPISEEYKRKWARLALETATSKKLRVVFLVGFWEIYSRPSFAQELQQTVQEFNQRGVRVVFVCDNPAQTKDPSRQARLALRWSWMSQPTPIPPEIHREKNSVVNEAVADLPAEADVVVVDIAPTILEWKSLLSEDGQLLYYDDDHLSDAGAMRLRPLFESIFEELAK